MILKVVLNGTAENLWHRFGLSQNPFPQIAKAEYAGYCLTVQKLGGDPIPGVEYIQETLRGFSEEFVSLCCERFVPGKVVTFTVEF